MMALIPMMPVRAMMVAVITKVVMEIEGEVMAAAHHHKYAQAQQAHADPFCHRRVPPLVFPPVYIP
jgi:hypothetical protein